ncbi:LPD23 domain-containing protein [Pasteurella oralis]|uniref:LPD3 domain-containing protein n=1 Tax=Pasteurella oralis TaxID=1071947 RepID=UPI000C7C9804|nr:LPD23 domain-containing protein [Pasteurella oralis]
MSAFKLSNDEYQYMQKTVFGNKESQVSDSTPIFASEAPRAEEQGFMGDAVDSFQMGVWRGASHLARGLGVALDSDWLNKAADWAARGADENMATMSTRMQEALGQSAFDGFDEETGEGRGALNAYWWAGNLGALLGEQLDTIVTLGSGKLLTEGIKTTGKVAGKYLTKEVAEQVGEVAVKEAAKRGVPQHLQRAMGVTAVMSAMSAGGRASQVYDEVGQMSNQELANLEGFKQAYWGLKESPKGQNLTHEELFEQAKQSFKNQVGRTAALDPAAIATDIVSNSFSGLGGGLWGLAKPGQTIKGGLLKGALLESTTEGVQGAAEQYAINKTAQEYYDPSRELTEGMKQNIADGMVLGSVFGGVTGGIDTITHKNTMSKERKRIVDAIETGNPEIDAQLQRYTDNINQWANDVDDLVINIQRANAMNQRANVVAEQMRMQKQQEDNQADDINDDLNALSEESGDLKLSRSQQEIPSFYETENRLGGQEAYQQAVKDGKTELSYRQWVQVRTPEFKAWFGDWESDPENASKVINPRTGEPLVVYHGSNAEFTVFDKNKIGTTTDNGMRGKGFYFSPNKDLVSMNYGSNVTESFLNSRQPFDPLKFDSGETLSKHLGIDDGMFSFTPNADFKVYQPYSSSLTSAIKDNGYDGVSYPNRLENVVFEPNQIKSATNNTGAFDHSNADIRFSKALQKPDRLEKLRQAKPIEITGNEIQSSDDLRQYKRNALKYGKLLRGAYTNKDTGREIHIGRASITEILRHDYKDVEHLQSIAAIPQIIENAVYIDTLPNEEVRKNPDVKEYEYYLAGLKIGGEDYTVRAVVGVSTTGDKYYDHKLTKIEKGNLLEMTSRVSTAEISSSSPLPDVNDKRLLQILQQQNAEREQTHNQIKRFVGKHLSKHFEVVTATEIGITDPTVEAGYNPKTGKIFIVADNIRASNVLTRDERLAWVAWHELAHRGLGVKFGAEFNDLMAKIDKNSTINKLANAIQKQRSETAQNRHLAVEEALAELHAAYVTGKLDELKSRYGIEIPKGHEKGLKSWLEMTAQRIREFIAKLFGKETADKFSHDDLIKLLSDIKRNAGGEVRTKNSVNMKHSFAGETAKTANHSLLKQAKQEIENGADPEVVRQQTGWFKGADGKWRFEIDDRSIKLKGEFDEKARAFDVIMTLKEVTGRQPVVGDIFDAPDLFQAYPDLAKIEVQYDMRMQYGADAYYSPIAQGKEFIAVEPHLPVKHLKTTFIHELQHAIQERENFAKGASPSQFRERDLQNLSPLEAYERTAGEVEARNAQWRSVFNEEARRNISPFKTQDVATDDQIILFDHSGEVHSINEALNVKADTVIDEDSIKNLERAKEQGYNTDYYYRHATQEKEPIEKIGNKGNLGGIFTIQNDMGGQHPNGVPYGTQMNDENGISVALLPGNGVRSIYADFDPNKAEQPYLRLSKNAYESDADKIKRAFESIGVRAWRNSSMALNSEYVTVEIPNHVDEFGDPLEYKIRVSDHALPSYYSQADFDVSPRGAVNNSWGKSAIEHSNGDWIEAVKHVVNKYDLPIPAVVKRLEHKPKKDGESNKKPRRKITKAEKELKRDILEQEELISRLENSGVEISDFHPFKRVLSNYRAQLSEIIAESKRKMTETQGMKFSRSNTFNNASVLELSRGGNIESEPKWWNIFTSRQKFKEVAGKGAAKLDEWLADSLRPVNDWIDEMKFSDDTGKTSSRDHEKRRLKDAMYTAKGKRDALNSELETNFLKPILSKIAQIAKQSNSKINEETAKRKAGFWVSARYSIEKNMELLKIDKQAMLDAEKALNDAKANGTTDEVREAQKAFDKAEKQYLTRRSDVWNKDFNNKNFKVGVAGGWSIPEAQEIMRNIEKDIPRSELEHIGDLITDLNQARLEIDYRSGRYTTDEYNKFKENRHYVPLTGDPNAEADDFDFIGGTGSNALNITKDRSLKGRTSSEAEDAIDAVWKAVGKTTTYAGWSDFKNKIDDLFETEVSLLKDKGYTEKDAREQASKNIGISKRRMQGLTRSSDNVLIAKQGGLYYEYELPEKAMNALKNDNVEYANAFLKAISKPTSWYARGVTQWTLTFAPINMLRDTWEKSEFIRVQKVHDKDGKQFDSKIMDRIGRGVWNNALNPSQEVWQATKRFGFGQELRDSVESERLLKELLKNGGVSNYGTYLDRTETDLIKKLKRENNPVASKLDKVAGVLESYNKMFDTVSALAAYKSLIDNGVDSKQAAAITLELTNFRKTGSKMKGIKALYLFSQPTVMGAANLIRYLSTRKGQMRFLTYIAGMTALYTVLRSMDDEDEGGNKMDQLGDITRFIPIPIGNGDYFKMPVGFGMPQMAWNFATNLVKGTVSDISFVEAGVNMLSHSMKTFAPVSPSEISAAKYPLEKLALTATPSILQPLMQNVINRSAFGNKITTNFVREDKLKAEQSKSTTAQFWKDLAIDMQQATGIDMHPEQIKNLFDGYSAMLGSLRELNTIFIDNPNREQLGRNTRTPFLNQLYGAGNEFAVQSRYYEASEEAQSVFKEYAYRKENKQLNGWLTPERKKLIKFHEKNAKAMGELRSEKAKLTRQLREGKISSTTYESRIKKYNQSMDKLQRKILTQYRRMEGLNTH